MTELTQHEKIVKLMVIRPDHVWWYPYDFMRGELLRTFRRLFCRI